MVLNDEQRKPENKTEKLTESLHSKEEMGEVRIVNCKATRSDTKETKSSVRIAGKCPLYEGRVCMKLGKRSSIEVSVIVTGSTYLCVNKT